MKNIRYRQLFSGVDIESYNIVEVLLLLILKTERFDLRKKTFSVFISFIINKNKNSTVLIRLNNQLH